MSIEHFRAEDIAAVNELLKDNEELKNDYRVKKAIETGLNEYDEPVTDLGNYVASLEGRPAVSDSRMNEIRGGVAEGEEGSKTWIKKEQSE
jgi:hypothetical protein